MHGFHDLKITGVSNRFKLSLDGQEINGITAAKFSAGVGEIPTLELTLFVGDYDIDVQTLELNMEDENNDGKEN